MKIVCFNSAFIDVENYLIYYRRYSCPVLRDSVIKSPGVLLKMDAPFVNDDSFTVQAISHLYKSWES